MAQGGLKKRSDKFSATSSKRKFNNQKKSRPLGPRKGGKLIFQSFESTLKFFSTVSIITISMLLSLTIIFILLKRENILLDC